MVQANTELEPDAVFRDARRRTLMVLRLNIALTVTIAVILIATIATAIIVGFLGEGISATALGGVALLDLIGAAVYRPLEQVNRACLKSQHVDFVILSARERLYSARMIQDPADQAVAVKLIWSGVLADINELEK
jgi:hypothetical protein